MNNRKLRIILKNRPDIKQRDLMNITGRSRTMVHGWMQEPGHKHFKKIRDCDLRHIRLELGLTKPRYAK